MSRERDITAASYIYKFYTEIQTLNHEYSNYVNILLELQNKYADDVEKKADDQEKAVIKAQVQAVRYAAHQSYIHYNSIMIGTGNKPLKEITDLYSKIKTQFMINRETLEKFVTSINSVLVNEVIKNLLETSQDLIKDIYKDANTEPTA